MLHLFTTDTLTNEQLIAVLRLVVRLGCLALILATERNVHFFGDYVLQWYEIAMHKRFAPHLSKQKNLINFAIATFHGFLYGVPYLVYMISWQQYLAISICHAIVDYAGIGALGVRLTNRDWGDWRVETKAPSFVPLTWDQEIHHLWNKLVLSVPYFDTWREVFALWSLFHLFYLSHRC